MSAADRVAAIRARLDAAAPGPWVTADGDISVEEYVYGREGYVANAQHMCVEDADLIANAPADLAWCLSELEYWRGRAERAELKSVRGLAALRAELAAMRADRDQFNRQLNDIYAARFLASDGPGRKPERCHDGYGPCVYDNGSDVCKHCGHD